MAGSKKRRLFPIQVKTLIIIVVLAIVIVEAAMTYFSLVSSRRNRETFANFTDSLSGSVAATIDKNDADLLRQKVDDILVKIPEADIVTSEEEDETKIEEYMANFAPLEQDTEFQTAFNRVRSSLVDITKASEKTYVTSIYIAHIHVYNDAEGNKQGLFIYLVDSAEEDPCPPGWADPLYEQNRGILVDPTIGMPAYETNTGYGYLVTSCTYIAGSDMLYAAVDVSMTEVRSFQANSIISLFIYMVITIILVAAAGMITVYFIFNKPLKKITAVADSYDDKDPKRAHENFVNLNIKTHDELAVLADSIKQMEQGVNERIEMLTGVNKKLIESQQQAHKMSVLANKDPLTGVKSKVAYHTVTEELNARIEKKENLVFGIVLADLNCLKQINDEHGHNAGDAAIIRLSNLICLVFKHSPVYRVGGDEFVVIIENNDYQDIDKLIVEFNERMEDIHENENLPVYERIRAAIGYAKFDAKLDKNVDETFNRADQAMYKRKHLMKQEK